MKRIISPTDDGGVAIVVPSPEALETMTIEEIAAKDVPASKPYKIVDITDFPLELDAQGNSVLDEFGVVKHDRTFRNAWEYPE